MNSDKFQTNVPFFIQKVKGKLNCDVIMFCKPALQAIIQRYNSSQTCDMK